MADRAIHRGTGTMSTPRLPRALTSRRHARATYGGLKGNVLGWAPLLSAIARRDPRLLPPEGYESFFAPQSLASGRPTGHALSWFVGTQGRHPYLCHAGGGPGYGSEIRIYPSLRAASALLTNTTIV